MSYDVFELATEVTRTRAEWVKLDATAMDLIMNDADYGTTWKHIQEGERHAFRQYQHATFNLPLAQHLARPISTVVA